MALLTSDACLNLDPATFRHSFDREPFEFRHTLSGLHLFEFDSLERLAAKYNEGDYFVAAGAPTPGTAFYTVPHSQCTPVAALARLESDAYRVLLKRPENHDAQFRELLEALFKQVVDLRG